MSLDPGVAGPRRGLHQHRCLLQTQNGFEWELSVLVSVTWERAIDLRVRPGQPPHGAVGHG